MKRKWKIIFGIIIFIVMFMVVINIIPPAKVTEDNPFITTVDKGPMLAAHRGGKVLNPENTMKAFETSVNEYDVDILEMDLCLTKDEKLVIIHNLYINSYCDVEEILETEERMYVNDFTHEELLQFNFGYKFKTLSGETPYEKLCEGLSSEERKQVISDNQLNILLINELFDHFYDSQPDLLYIIEIKNEGELGMKAADILNELLTVQYPNLLHRVVIGTFHDEIEEYLKEKCPLLYRGASTGAATSFIITEIVNVNLFDSGSFVCLQIPVMQDIKIMTLELMRNDIISRAHKRNIAVQYWTINDAETMKSLVDLGCDAIMTDNPALLHEVLVERGYRS